MDLSGVVWRKSRRSGNGGADCVEVGVLEHPGLMPNKPAESRFVVVRNSNDPEGPVVPFTKSEWDAFLGGVTDGDFADLI